MYEIEKGIPVVPARNSKKIYPLDSMGIDDSVLLPKNANAYSAAHYYGKNGKKFTARAVEGGVRVWRTQ